MNAPEHPLTGSPYDESPDRPQPRNAIEIVMARLLADVHRKAGDAISSPAERVSANTD